MTQKLPRPLREVADQLARLPGFGPKSALRASLALLGMPREQADGLGRAILALRERLCFCSRCNAISEFDPCPVCDDPGRAGEQLVLVSDLDSLLAMEEGGFFRGRYLVLGGLLAPLDKIDPDQLAFDRLRDRLTEGEVRELILALGTTMEAEATASYVKNMVERDFPDVNVTRLAQGIPLGSEVRYVDKETLRQSLLHRQRL